MKKLSSFFIVLSLFLFNFSTVSAHLAGQPPFFEINGKIAAQYNVPSTSLEDFPLPQDIGVDRYLVNTPIQFHIKAEILGVPRDIAQNTTFRWDFGDGTRGDGLDNSHIYKKPGSYTVAIDAVYKNDSVLIESAMLQVVPNTNYKLPQAQLYINDQMSNDPLIDILHFPFKTSLRFDASKTPEGSGKIVSYRWDFGDGNQSTEITTNHSYTLDSDMVFPVLRVTDENGFISDTFVQINKGDGTETPRPQKAKVQTDKNDSKPYLKIAFGFVFVVLCVLIALYFMTKKKKK